MSLNASSPPDLDIMTGVETRIKAAYRRIFLENERTRTDTPWKRRMISLCIDRWNLKQSNFYYDQILEISHARFFEAYEKMLEGCIMSCLSDIDYEIQCVLPQECRVLTPRGDQFLHYHWFQWSEQHLPMLADLYYHLPQNPIHRLRPFHHYSDAHLEEKIAFYTPAGNTWRGRQLELLQAEKLCRASKQIEHAIG